MLKNKNSTDCHQDKLKEEKRDQLRKSSKEKKEKSSKDPVVQSDGQTYVDLLLGVNSSEPSKTQEMNNTQKLEDELKSLQKMRNGMIKEELEQPKRRSKRVVDDTKSPTPVKEA